MKFAGIIAEYDPFHSGHAAQLAMARARGAQRVAVCLSAGATQRGGIPLLPEAVRVRAALRCGADLVIALPAPYACASAEGFAAAGVALLTALGCDTLLFGAETPDTDRLMRTARLLCGGAFPAALRRQLDAGLPFAAARAAAAEALQPGSGALLARPNDILGVEYCKAILTQGSPLTPLALPRVGAAHDAPAPAGGIASAGALRALFAEQGMAALAPWLPLAVCADYRQAEAEGQTLDSDRLSTAILARLRGRTAAELAGLRGMGEGLEHRLARALTAATTLDALYAALATKRYPNARLRRLVLDAALGIPADLEALPPWLHVLGARREALGALGAAALPVSTSLRDLERGGPAAARAARLYAGAVDLGALCRRRPAPAGLAYTQKPVIL